jgi:predicted RNA-binding Zn ribbon-like protein
MPERITMPGPPSPALPFEWVGGSPALDFTNTVSWTTPERANERLRSYADLVRWTGEAGLADSGEVRSLSLGASACPREADRVLGHALQFREALHDVFSAQAAGSRAEVAAVNRLNRFVGRALERLTLGGQTGGGWSWEWNGGEELHRPLWRIAWSAAQLLTSEDLPALKRCAADQCGWVFLDRSRNHARRWCDMKVCGNNEKARRFYRRRSGKALD